MYPDPKLIPAPGCRLNEFLWKARLLRDHRTLTVLQQGRIAGQLLPNVAKNAL